MTFLGLGRNWCMTTEIFSDLASRPFRLQRLFLSRSRIRRRGWIWIFHLKNVSKSLKKSLKSQNCVRALESPKKVSGVAYRLVKTKKSQDQLSTPWLLVFPRFTMHGGAHHWISTHAVIRITRLVINSDFFSDSLLSIQSSFIPRHAIQSSFYNLLFVLLYPGEWVSNRELPEALLSIFSTVEHPPHPSHPPTGPFDYHFVSNTLKLEAFIIEFPRKKYIYKKEN